MIEDKIQEAIKPIISIYSQIELEIIEKIARHFKLNEEFINSDYWYFEKLKEMGGLNNETMKLLEKYTGKRRQELLKAMQEIGINAIPVEQLNLATQKGALLNPQTIINSVNIQNLIKYSYNEIEKTFLQLNRTIEEQVKKTYTDIITQAYIKTNSGVYSYQEAILECLDELGNKGISVLTYQDKNGLKKNYDVVGTVRRDLLVATRGLAGKVNEEVIKESGHHIVRVSHHFGARTGDGEEDFTNHAWWQEKQFFCWDYDGKATEEEKKLPDFMEHCNYGHIQGIVGINCKHFFTIWYGPLEKDKLDFTYEENEEQYNKTQQQRYLENGVRKWKRKQVIANKAQDEEGYKKASAKTKEWQERLREFTYNNDLKRDYTREHIKVYKVSTNDNNYDIIKQSKKTIKGIKQYKVQQKNSQTVKNLNSIKIEYNPVKKLKRQLTNEEIIKKISGGDETKGSCSSVALAYIGNKNGLDVNDFRGGESQNFFSTPRNVLQMCDDLKIKYEMELNYNDTLGAMNLLNKVEEGKEYYLSTGAHATIVRKIEGKFQYLEMQDKTDNGFKQFTSQTLKKRFGCKQTHTIQGYKAKARSLLINVDEFTNKNEFRKVLGYINTPENKQLKGVNGNAK